jgi:hypothetical protein
MTTATTAHFDGDHLHCASCSPRHGIHCAYHCSLFLTETIRVMGEQNVTQRQAEDVVLRRLRMEAQRAR